MYKPGVHRQIETGRPRYVLAVVGPVDVDERAGQVYGLRVAQRSVWDTGNLRERQGPSAGQGQSLRDGGKPILVPTMTHLTSA